MDQARRGLPRRVQHVEGRRTRRCGWAIPIARSTFRCLACPCVVLGRDLAYRPVSTVSTRLQAFP
jgi:hypothetical protein